MIAYLARYASTRQILQLELEGSDYQKLCDVFATPVGELRLHLRVGAERLYFSKARQGEGIKLIRKRTTGRFVAGFSASQNRDIKKFKAFGCTQTSAVLEHSGAVTTLSVNIPTTTKPVRERHPTAGRGRPAWK